MKNSMSERMERRSKPIFVVDGCADEVCSAIDQLVAAWGPYSSRSKRYSIYSLMDEKLGSAIQAYMENLPLEHHGHTVGFPGYRTDLGIGDLAKVTGFKCLEQALREATRRYIWMPSSTSTFPDTHEATLETLYGAVIACGAKRPKKSKAGKHEKLNAERIHSPQCHLCGELHELAAYVAKGTNLTTKKALQAEVDELNLSSRYCKNHRPKSAIDGKWGSAYKRAMRTRDQFNKEEKQIRRHCGISRNRNFDSLDPMVHRFYQLLHAREALYLDEDQEIGNLARSIVEAKISDRKKQIVAMLATGTTQSEIARKIGVKRQAISKAIATIPTKFRLDVALLTACP